MPRERAGAEDFLVAAVHIRRLMAITDEIDDLIPCSWLSSEEAAQLRACPRVPVLMRARRESAGPHAP